ncbi:S46 family peptidase [Uliginosibacterium gangwonense]|uniref:S46 family peptidase n=1 Tax=Uliginosibacterium gangwonense TaxID=392736 RepID=UPI00036BDCE4|nr:S46 family peptidase [Uliginosibacterium gangwonense]
MFRLRISSALLALVPCFPAQAAEGLWPFNQAPVAAFQAQYGFTPSAQWLAHLQGAAVNFGASGSFVSPEGLVLTNHHVVLDCVSKLSSAQRDLVKNGFVAHSHAEELRCSGDDATVLIDIVDVTTKIRAAEDSAQTDEERANARRGVITAIENTCQKEGGASQKCQVVSLYQGAAYHLYRSERYDDVRLVFAPEYQVGFYGGDPDNFVYPRFAVDMGLVRLYRDGKPVHPKHWLKIDPAGPKPGEILFVAGHPGRTERLKTEAQLRFLRDVQNPLMLAGIKRRIDVVLAYAKQSAEANRQATETLFGLQNWYKSLTGAQEALSQPRFFARKSQQEADLRAKSAGKVAGDPWEEMAAVVADQTPRAKLDWLAKFPYHGLLSQAGLLVQWARQSQLPEDKRLPEFRSAALPNTLDRIKTDEPYYKDLELALSLDRAKEAHELLGDHHPYTLALSGEQGNAKAFLSNIYAQTRIGDVAERKRLLAAGPAAIETSDDPMLVLARALEPIALESQQFTEDHIKTLISQAAAKIEQARYAAFGAAVAPDATGTLRLSYGEAKGYVEHGISHPWKTTVGGLYDRATSFAQQTPFDLAPSWRKARSKLNPDTPLDYVLTADIVGGNSGSPIVNRAGNLVGLIFDGNLASLGIYYQYGDDTERAIAVHPAAIMAALDKVYGAKNLVREMTPKQ